MQLLVCLMLVALSPLAQATILGNGQTGPPSFLDPGGTELAFTHGTITTNTFSTLYSVAVFSDPNNTFCAGCLDFTYRFTNNGPDVNERFTGFNFDSFRVDVGYDPSTSGVIPLTVNRSSTGSVIGFNYTGSDSVMAGQSTVLLVIETNAKQFMPGFVSAQDGTAGSGVAFQPTGLVIPEPSSLSLLGGGLLMAGSLLRKFNLGK
jgi:hypothetical protein